MIKEKVLTEIRSDDGFRCIIQTYEEKFLKSTTILNILKRQITATKQSKVKVGERLKTWIENNWLDFQRNLKKKKIFKFISGNYGYDFCA